MRKLLALLALTLLVVSCTPKVVVTATSTPPPTETPRPTPTPTCTPVPKPQIPADWKRFEGAGIVLYLPDSWEGWSEKELDELLADLEGGGSAADRTARYLDDNRSSLQFLLLDTAAEGVALGTDINILRTTYERVSLATYIDTAGKNLAVEIEDFGGTMEVIRQETGPLGSLPEVGHLVVEYLLPSRVDKLMQYIVVIKEGDCFWAVTLSTSVASWEEYEPIFEQAIQSLKILED